MSKGYKTRPLSFNRKMVAASVSVTKQKSAIHSFAEIDISEPRRLIKEHFEKTGEKLSFTAYIVICLAQVIQQHPVLNSFLKRNKLVLLDDVTVNVLIEREFNGEKIPESVGIQQAQLKTFRQIQNEIRRSKKDQTQKLGSLSGNAWINYIPGFLLKAFIRIADRNIKMAKRYGKVAVTAVGMFSKEPIWFIPHGTATVLVTVGSISNKVVEYEGGFAAREHLCLTVSFDHTIVDGAPAARFMNQFIETIKSGTCLFHG
jgi:pyruvate/2-oxoglutarate dehydrogenase complex dihydrolipoamide acyltransferase (E2) component